MVTAIPLLLCFCLGCCRKNTGGQGRATKKTADLAPHKVDCRDSMSDTSSAARSSVPVHAEAYTLSEEVEDEYSTISLDSSQNSSSRYPSF